MSSGNSYRNGTDRARIEWDDSYDCIQVILPHQCDAWVIGNADDVRAIIADLTALLPEFEHPERYCHEHACVQCGRAFIVREGTCSQQCPIVSYNKGRCHACQTRHWQENPIRVGRADRLRSFPESGEQPA